MMADHSEEVRIRMRRQAEEAYHHAMRSQQQNVFGRMGVGEMEMQQALRGQVPFTIIPDVQPKKNQKLLLLL
jgi:hypothetical protein